MGCVPCELTAHVAPSAAAWAAGEAAELPLFASLPHHTPPLGAGDVDGLMAAGLPAAHGQSGRLAAAEATARELRSQLAQLQQVNRELYGMAVDATLGVA